MDGVKLTGLWKNKSKDGSTHLRGVVNAITAIVVLPNTYKKEGDKSPDYFLYLTPKAKDKEQTSKTDNKDSDFACSFDL